MTKPGFINVYSAGDALLIVPMAGWGGGYRETEVHHKAASSDTDLQQVLGEMLDRSDLRPGAFERRAVPFAKTGYGKAAAMARRRSVVLRCVQLVRDETGTLTLQLLGPVPGQRGLGPDGAAEHPITLSEAANRIRALIDENR